MDMNFPLAKKTEFFCRRSREIDERRFAFARQVVDAHVDFLAVGGIDHLEPAVQGEIPGSRRHAVGIITLPRECAASVKAFCIV